MVEDDQSSPRKEVVQKNRQKGKTNMMSPGFPVLVGNETESQGVPDCAIDGIKLQSLLRYPLLKGPFSVQHMKKKEKRISVAERD